MPQKPLESIAISEFKATCLAVLDRVRRTGVPVLVTRRGEPMAEVGPPSHPSARGSWLGSMQGTATIEGNLVEPSTSTDEWDALAR